jgi:hypothetical protein
MSLAIQAPPSGLPWSLRLFRSMAMPWPLLLTLTGYLLCWVVWFAITGSMPRSPFERGFFAPAGWWETTVRGLLLAYTPTLMWLGRRGAIRDLEDLRPLARAPEAGFAARATALLQIDRARLRWAGVVGALGNLAILSSEFSAGELERSLRSGALDARLLWDGAWFALLGWLLMRALVDDIRMARGFSRIGASSLDIDLLDLRPLMPLTRWGLRTVLLWAIWFSIMSLFWITPGPKNPGNALGILPLLAVTVSVFVLPVLGVHRRIRDAKHQELERVREDLMRERDLLMEDPGGGSTRLAELAAYRGLIEGVREWPFDVSAYVRFFAYLTLGVGSWLGAATVERALAWLLERP